MNNILLITAIFGFILTSLLFFKKSINSKATFFLGCFYFIISVYTWQTYVIEAGYLYKFPWLFLWPLFVYHLITVPIYFYFEAVILDKFYWKKRYFLLFIPFLLGIVDVVSVYASPNGAFTQLLHGAITDTENRFKAHYWMLSLYEHYIIRHVWQAVFLLVLLPKLLVFLKEGSSDKLKTTLNKWLLFFWLILMLMSLLAILHGLEKQMEISVFDYLFNIENGTEILTVILYSIMFSIGVIPIYFPTILHGYPRSRKLTTTSNKPMDQSSDLRFGLEESEIKAKLDLIGKKKLYLEQDFNVTKCARELEMPAHHISYFLNQYYGLSFAAYKNKLRITHAQSLIQNGFLGANTMDSLAEECGFGNRSSFSKAFKSFTNQSPSEYAQNHQHNS